jgi:cell division protease FtsH
MVTEWGMSDKLGRVRYTGNEQEVFLGHSVTQTKNLSDETAKLIDDEVRGLIEAGEQTARRILKENEEALHAIAKALLEHETLNGEEVRRVIRGEPIIRDTSDTPKGPTGSAVPTAGKSRKRGEGEEPSGGMEPMPT